MPTDKLSPYWVRLRSKNKPGVAVDESEYFDLTSLPDPDGGFESFDTILGLLLFRFAEYRDVGFVDDDRDKSLTIRQLETSTHQPDHDSATIEGVLGHGNFGRSADHLDISDLKRDLPPSEARRPNARDQDTAEVGQIYFLFHIPSGKPSRGILILHSWGRARVKGLLYKSLQIPLFEDYEESGSNEDRGLNFEMNPIASKDLIERLTEVTIHGFELVKRNTPTSAYASSSDILGNARDAKARFTIETDTEISLDEEKAQTIVSMVQDSDYPYAEIFPPEVNQHDIDKVQAHIDGEGSNKLNLEREKVRMEKVIDGDVKIDSQTYRPVMSSVGELAREFANDQLVKYDLDPLSTDSMIDSN